jgi:hypothetical protein
MMEPTIGGCGFLFIDEEALAEFWRAGNVQVHVMKTPSTPTLFFICHIRILSTKAFQAANHPFVAAANRSVHTLLSS